MARLRSLLTARPWLALAFVVAALAVRAVIPVGMMPGHGRDGATLIVCPGQTTMPGMVMAGAAAKGHHADPAKTDAPCAFTGLLAAAHDGNAVPVIPAPPELVTMLALAGLVAVTARTRRLRPPSHGPPTRA